MCLQNKVSGPFSLNGNDTHVLIQCMQQQPPAAASCLPTLLTGKVEEVGFVQNVLWA